MYGIVTHKISPFEQKAFAGVISKGVPNTFRRIRAKAFIVAPRKLESSPAPRETIDVYAQTERSLLTKLDMTLINFILLAFLLGYFAYSYAEMLHDSYLRKNPAEFANDE